MAEGEKRIFELKIDQGDYEKKIAGFTADLIKATEAKKALDKAYKDGKINTEEYGKQLAANKRQTAEVSGELRAHTKVLEIHNKQTKANAGSNNALRAELSNLTAAYNALGKEERENTEDGRNLQKQIKAISDELKQNEQAVGDARRSVGGYSQGILDAADNMGILGTFTSQVKDAQEKFSIALEFTRKGLLTNVGALKLFKLALAATGIGLVVIALAGLYSFLTKTQEGIDWVSTKTKGLTTVLGVVTDKLSDFGQIIFEAFSKPKQALTDLMGFLEKQVTNRLKSFAVIWDGIRKGDLKQLNNGLFQLTTGFENVVDKAQALKKELEDANEAGKAVERETIRIREAERQLNVDRDNSRKKIKELNLLAEDTTKGIQERTKAAREAIGIEERLNARRLELQRAVVANIEKENSLTKSGVAELDKLAEAQSNLANMEAESLELRTELTNKLNTLRNEGAAQMAAATLKELEDRKAATEAQLLQVREGTQARLDLQEELVLMELAIQNKGADLSLNQRKLNELKANAEILALRSEFYKRDVEKQMEYRGILGELNKTAENGVTEDSFQAMEDRRQKLLAKDAEINDAKITAAEHTKNTLAEIDQERLQAATDAVSALSSLVELAGAQSEEAANFQRALAVFQIGIDTAAAVMTAIRSAQGVPFPANIPAALTSVAAVLAGLAQSKALLSQGNAPKAPKFDTGGYTGSGFGSPDESGYKIAGIVHENEYVAPEVVLRDPRAAGPLMQLETLRKMKLPGYDTGGYTSPMVRGIQLPASTRQLTRDEMFNSNYGAPAMPQMIDYTKLAAAMAKLPAPIVRTTDLSSALNNQEAVKVRTSQR